MNYQKQNFVDGEVLSASQLNHMEDGIANAAGAGISETAKELMLSLFENATYKTDDAQDTLNALRAEWGVGAQEVPVQSVSLSSSTMTLYESEVKFPDGYRAARRRHRPCGGVERFSRRLCYGGKR